VILYGMCCYGRRGVAWSVCGPICACVCWTHVGWRRGVVVSGDRRVNEVNARRARLVLGGRLQAGVPS